MLCTADQDFTELVAKVPDGCRFTMVSDSCHSGGLIDKTKEQIGNSTKQNRTQQQQRREREMKPPPGSGTGLCASLARIVRGVLESLGAGIRCNRRGHHQGSSSSSVQKPADDTKAAKGGSIGNRSLPLSTFIQMLKDKTGRHDVGVGSIRTTLFHHFGDEASPKVKRFMKVMAGKLRHDGKDEAEQSHAPAPREAEALAQEQDTHSVEEVYAGPAAAARLPPRNGVLISGCQTDETSADATTADGMSYGALSNAIQTILAGNGNGNGKKRGAAVTNRELVVRARELLSKQGYTQQPGLYCSDEHARLPFIC
jgi:hypothetical protein